MFSLLKKKKQKDTIAKQLISETEFVVVDTELTGLNEYKDNIIAIGAIKMKGRTIKIGDVFYRTVSPSTTKFRKESIMIHKITPSELEKCPEIAPILREFLKFSESCLFIGHCLDIDLAFLRKEIKNHLKENFNPLGIDTFLIYKWLIRKGVLPESFDNKNTLEEVALSLEIDTRELHDALSDAFITAQVFQKLLFYLSELKIFTIGELIDIGSEENINFRTVLKKESYSF